MQAGPSFDALSMHTASIMCIFILLVVHWSQSLLPHDSTYTPYRGKPEHPQIPVKLLSYVVLNCTCPEMHDVSTRTCAGLKGARVDAVIAVAVIVFVLALVTLRSWQLRRRRRLGYLVQNTWEFRLRNQIRRCFGEHTAATFAIGLYCLVTHEDGFANWVHCFLLPLQLAARVQRHLEVYVVHSSILSVTALLLQECNPLMYSTSALLVQACNL